MVAASENNKKGDKKMYVTKLPSKGGSCGTVDILESGGLSFPTDAEAIVQECKKEQGVICQPTDALAPVDKVLMDARRATNLMTNFPFVYASILSKRIAIGCTHCIVDVKIGKDTKMLSPCMNEQLLELVSTNFVKDGMQKLVFDSEYKEILINFKRILSDMIQGTTTQLPDTTDKRDWIEQKCEDKQLNKLTEVRWLLTNSSMPQCRAIGRHLILIHINELIENNDDLLKHDNEYKKLYMKVLPDICGVSDRSRSLENLSIQWGKLKKKLPKIETKIEPKIGTKTETKIENQFAVAKYLKDLKEDKDRDLEKSYGEKGKDLKIITFGLYPYQLQARGDFTIKRMNAYLLDKMFEWLCGEETYDPEVGVWLHKLPGETVKALITKKEANQSELNFKNMESTNTLQDPIISIFYRPSRCTEAEVIARVREFLCRGVNDKIILG